MWHQASLPSQTGNQRQVAWATRKPRSQCIHCRALHHQGNAPRQGQAKAASIFFSMSCSPSALARASAIAPSMAAGWCLCCSSRAATAAAAAAATAVGSRVALPPRSQSTTRKRARLFQVRWAAGLRRGRGAQTLVAAECLEEGGG